MFGQQTSMSKDWWPSPLGHIRSENPWAHDPVIVAEVKSFDEPPHPGHRKSTTALVPIEQLEVVKEALANFDHEVSTNGPYPSIPGERPFKPAFWIAAKELPSEKYEPLVLQWDSHDSTVLQPDPGFLMTYGLVPRLGNSGVVYWDDAQTPLFDIVTVSPPSVWKAPLGTHAYVGIARDFLQDYLTLRHMALVEVFWEQRSAKIDPDISERLGEQDGININFADRCFQLGRYPGECDAIYAQVWGARLIALPDTLPITSPHQEALAWPGIEQPVTKRVARKFRPFEYVYVDDAVLCEYEGRPEFSIHPESGSVRYGTRWIVDYCSRVGRNLIRLDVKKLYEGVPPHVIRHIGVSSPFRARRSPLIHRFYTSRTLQSAPGP